MLATHPADMLSAGYSVTALKKAAYTAADLEAAQMLIYCAHVIQPTF